MIEVLRLSSGVDAWVDGIRAALSSLSGAVNAVGEIEPSALPTCSQIECVIVFLLVDSVVLVFLLYARYSPIKLSEILHAIFYEVRFIGRKVTQIL